MHSYSKPQYQVNHFSLSLPKGDGQANVPKLLLHLANALKEYDDISILDIVFHGDVYVDNELYPQITVYYTSKEI